VTITIRDRHTGEDYRGRSPESIARRVWARRTTVVYSPDPNSDWLATVVRKDQRGYTHVLAELFLTDKAWAAREDTDHE
jgi:hypothetical protein